MHYEVTPVAFVRAQRTEVVDDFWGGSVSTIELAEGVPASSLDGLDEFSHAEIIFLFDKIASGQATPGARRPRSNPLWPEVGIFAQRAKVRPNRLGATVVRVLARAGSTLRVAELDAIDGTPVLDIKPVFAEFLPRGSVRQPQWTHELMRDYWSTRRSS